MAALFEAFSRSLRNIRSVTASGLVIKTHGVERVDWLLRMHSTRVMLWVDIFVDRDILKVKGELVQHANDIRRNGH